MDHPAGIVGTTIGQVGKIHVEVFSAFGATVLRAGDHQIDGLVARQVSQIVQGPRDDLVSVALAAAAGAASFLTASQAWDLLGFRQIFHTSNAFGYVGQIFAGTVHGRVSQKEVRLSGSDIGQFSSRALENPGFAATVSKKAAFVTLLSHCAFRTDLN